MKSRIFFRLVLDCCLAFSFASWCEAKVKLPVLIADGMVLQREQEIRIWGNADQNETVHIEFLNQKYRTTADKQGEWQVVLPPAKAGGPYEMQINDIRIKDILIGDVWLCSGQSNMELPIRRVLDLYKEEVEAYSNPQIRYVKTPITYNYHHPEKDIPTVSWASLQPTTALSYSAVCYFFAKDLYEKYQVPIGIINSSVGGSPIESWISEAGLKPFPHYLHDRDMHRYDSYVANTQKFETERRSIWNAILFANDLGLQESTKWYEANCPDESWKTTDLDSKSWAKDQSGFVNGSIWFRKSFELTSDMVGKKAVLRLGCIVDADSVYVNGRFVGTTAYQYPPRIYPIPAGILKAGDNQISVRLISYSGMPQFVDEKPYKLILDENEIDLSKNWKYRIGVRMPALQSVGTYQQRPTGFYNAMIAPLQNLRFKGALWYQGESNTGAPLEYGELLSALIQDWRSLWQDAEMPFLVVQLPNFLKTAPVPTESNWAQLRESQRLVVRDTPNTGLAVAIDLGEWNDIHPLNKKEVARRLSLQAQRIAYKDTSIHADGPVYESMRMEGNKIILSFKEGTNELANTDELKGFAIAGKDQVYRWARARVEGHTIVVWCDEIQEPVSVRYAWSDNPVGANLKNTVGLPAAPFQTTRK